ncbi:MAG: hypothetical protein HQ551_01670 [Desulfobacteraceae bacterium]|nr:hypothetical protein [Desulfobacteraceae bacterium]
MSQESRVDLTTFSIQKTRNGLVAVTDAELTEAIIKILTDKNLAKDFSEHARRYVEKYLSWQIIASKHYGSL